MRRRPTAIILLVLLAALLVPAAASAGYEDFMKKQYLGPYNQDDCYYVRGEMCSNWNYWWGHELDRGGGGTVLQSYETGSVIRGRYRSAPGQYTLFSRDVSMGGWYLKGGALYWGGSYIWVDLGEVVAG
jgi:hypothetical protein